MTRKNPFIVGGPRLVVLVVLFVVVVAGGAVLGALLPRGSAARIGVAAVQGVCVMAYVGGLFLSIRQLDELEQRIQYEAIAHAFAATIIVVSAYGYVERAGLPRVEWSLWAYPLMFLFWGLAWAVVVRRYR